MLMMTFLSCQQWKRILFLAMHKSNRNSLGNGHAYQQGQSVVSCLVYSVLTHFKYTAFHSRIRAAVYTLDPSFRQLKAMIQSHGRSAYSNMQTILCAATIFEALSSSWVMDLFVTPTLLEWFNHDEWLPESQVLTLIQQLAQVSASASH